MSNLHTIFKVPLSGEGLILPSVVIFIGTKHRVQSPLERWQSMISMNRPKMESRPYQFLLQLFCLCFSLSIVTLSAKNAWGHWGPYYLWWAPTMLWLDHSYIFYCDYKTHFSNNHQGTWKKQSTNPSGLFILLYGGKVCIWDEWLWNGCFDMFVSCFSIVIYFDSLLLSFVNLRRFLPCGYHAC